MSFYVVHLHEVALKGNNRRHFERALRTHLTDTLSPLGKVSVRSFERRILIEHDGDAEAILTRVARVFGVAHTMAVERMPRELDVVAARITERVKELKPAHFRISTRRNDKRFPMRSIDIDRKIGAMVVGETGVKVKLTKPEFEAFVYVLENEILLGIDKRQGVSGLPISSSGRVMVLLSGGIDSPVAAWRMMRRGCLCEFVHFHSHPIVDRTSIEKAEELVEVLADWQGRGKLHISPLAEIQKQIRLHCPERLRVVLYRRFMVRIAERLARRNRCKALVTGESVGQVASQTIANIKVVNSLVQSMPVFRPLVAFNKQEIIDEAERIGTLEISNEPDQDCCKLFLPNSPILHASHTMCEEAEAKLDVEALVNDAIARTTRFTVGRGPSR